MRERIAWTAAESLPARADVLNLQGVPLGADLSPRISALVDSAFAAYLGSAEPRAVVGEIGGAAFRQVYRGDGRNPRETPLEAIFPRSSRLVVFVATVGPGVSDRIHDYFDCDHPALGAMLDSVASAAADRLATLLARRVFAPDLGPGEGERVLPYSPGYCGWHVSGQRALFAFLRPEEDIGVTLNPSCLMQPLKSVSGVLVAGPAEIHRFAPTFPFCSECREKPCRTRIASLAASGVEDS